LWRGVENLGVGSIVPALRKERGHQFVGRAYEVSSLGRPAKRREEWATRSVVVRARLEARALLVIVPKSEKHEAWGSPPGICSRIMLIWPAL
jgi:hypothetical protein